MARMSPLLTSARPWLVVAASLTLSGCLFPVIEWDERPSARELRSTRASLQGDLSAQPSAATPWRGRVTPARRHGSAGPQQTAAGARSPRTSVIAPHIPEPERPSPEAERECHAQLNSAGVRFAAVAKPDAPGVRWPIRLRGPVKGVVFQPEERSEVYAILDCRLALALADWAPELRRAGVRRVEYYSMYRPFARIAGSGTVSGHAHGMAIDAARFELQSGAVVDVLEDWEGRSRGQDPCPERSDEARRSRLLRAVTCAAVDRKLFQVVLTPHYNRAHDNHVHLEIKPEVDWTYVR